jgi:hypothetical protein
MGPTTHIREFCVVPAENICSNHPSVSKLRRPVFAPIIAHAPEDREAIRINAMISTGEATAELSSTSIP